MDDADPLATRLREGLGTVVIDAPIAEGLDGVRRRHRRTARRRRTAAGGIGAATLGLLLVSLVLLWPHEDGSQGLVTQPGPAPTTQPPATDDPAAAEGEGSIVIEPDGPYTDGQTINVELRGFQAADANYDTPQLCATIDGLETCDPMWQSTFSSTALPQMTFTASGWRDCGDPDVTCRIVVLGSDGEHRSSERLQFTGDAAVPDVTLTVDAPAGGSGVIDAAVVQPAGLETDSTWDRAADRIPDDLAPFVVQVCSFEGRLNYQCNILDYFYDIDPDRPNEAIQVPVSRDIFGYQGWRDCAAQPCFLLVWRTEHVTVNPDGSAGADQRAVAAAPLRFDPNAPAHPRPAITVLDSGPFMPGDDVTVRIDNLPASTNTGMELVLCRQDEDTVGGCGSFHTHQPATEGTTTYTLPSGDPWPAQCRQDGCLLVLRPAQEGAGPLAQTPITLTSAAP